MSKTMKKILINVCVFVCAICTFFGIYSAVKPVKAQSNFTMIGASLKLDGQNTGLRFGAEIDVESYQQAVDANAWFGMLIIPNDYLTTYADEIAAENGDFVMAFYNNDIDVLNIGVKPYGVDTDKDEQIDCYRMNGVISNVKYKNLNLKFVGIAYVKYVEGYEYASNYADYVRSALDVAEHELAENVELYDKAQLQSLYSYKVLAEAYENGDDEQTARQDLEAKTLKLANASYYGISDYNVVNFNSQNVLDLLHKGDNYKTNSYYNMSYEILEDGFAGETENVLKITSYAYTSLYIKFANPVEVKSDSSVYLKIYQQVTSQANWGSARIVKYNAGVEPNNNAGISLSLTNGQWYQKKTLLTDLGYAVGESCEGIQIVVQGVVDTDSTTREASCVYISDIKVASTTLLKEELASDLTGYQLLTFDNEGYQCLVSVDTSKAELVEVKDGVAVITTDVNYNFETFNFISPITVRKGDYINVRIQSNVRTRINIGGVQKELIHATSTENTFLKKPSENFQNVLIPLDVYGIAEGTVLSSIGITTWTGSITTYQVDSIYYLTATDYEAGQLVDLNKVGAEYLIANETVLSSYSYPSAKEYDAVNGCVKATGGASYNKFQLKLPNVLTLTANTQITIRLRYVPNDSTWGCRIVKVDTKGINNLNANNGYTGYVEGQWSTVIFNATTALGMAAGDELSFIEFAFSKGTVEIASVTYTEVA